ncbi:MAG: hypothetical protein ACJ72W_04680 [Actinoallomurus sp.]
MRSRPLRESGYWLLQRSKVIAEFDDDGGDQPWHHARLAGSSEGFQEVRRELAELRDSQRDVETLVRDMRALHRRLGLRLVVWPQGWKVRRFTLWVKEDGTASVRYQPPLGYVLRHWW